MDVGACVKTGLFPGAEVGWTLYPPDPVLVCHLSVGHDGGSWSLEYMCAQHS
jgi:hypothetical protein